MKKYDDITVTARKEIKRGDMVPPSGIFMI